MTKTRYLATRVTRCRVAEWDKRPLTHFAQWHHSRQVVGAFGPAHLSSFTTVVRRTGKRGWWVLKPYYISSGPLSYRRLPAMLTLRLRFAFARDAIYRGRMAVSTSVRAMVSRVCERLNPVAAYRKWQWQRHFDQRWS